MKRLIKYLLLILCVLSLVRTIATQVFYKSVYHEYEKTIVGQIKSIRINEDKVNFDIKSGRKLYVGTTYDEFGYQLGDIIKVRGTFYTASNNTVFNLFNYRKYLLSKNVDTLIKASKIELVSKNKNFFYQVKNLIIKRVNKYQSKAYLKTFLLGDTSEIEQGVKDNYQSMGVSHLMAVSGMHAALIITILNRLMKDYKHKNLFIFLILSFFLFLTNFTISLLRALLFILLKKLNDKLGLGLKSYSVIIVAASLLLLFNPYLVNNVGFVFSVIISFFIILLSYKLKDVKGYFKKIALVSLTAFFASVPIIALNFFKINLLSPIFNVILVPLVSLIIFPFSIVVFIFPFLDGTFMILINILEFLSAIFSDIKLFDFIISKPNFIFVLIYYVTLFFSIKVNKRYIIIFILLMIINVNSRFLIINPELTFLDVGQGDCAILILPFGKCVVIDAGGNAFKSGPISNDKIIPYLNSKGINSLDCLVVTHGDYDHMGEAVNLINNLKTKKVIFNRGDFNDLENELIKVLNKKNVPYYSYINELKVGDNRLLFLGTKSYDNENDNSNVIYTEVNNHKLLFMADAGVMVEQCLLENYNLDNIDVLKVGHHGSKTSSSKEFIDDIKPKYSIISVGKNNRYGHPSNEVLDNLEASKIYRTDQNGSIKFKIIKNKLEIKNCVP